MVEEVAGSRFIRWQDRDLETKKRKLAELRAGGELSDYSDEELLTFDFFSLWQKPR